MTVVQSCNNFSLHTKIIQKKQEYRKWSKMVHLRCRSTPAAKFIHPNLTLSNSFSKQTDIMSVCFEKLFVYQ